MTIIIANNIKDNYDIKIKNRPNEEAIILSKKEILNKDDYVFKSYVNTETRDLVLRIINNSNPLSKFCKSTSGFGGKSDLITENRINKKQIKILKGKSIKKYFLKKYFYFEFLNKNITGRTKDIAKLGYKEKILLRKTGNSIIAHYDNTGTFPEQSLYFLYQFSDLIKVKFILSLLNSKLYSWFYINELVTNLDSTPQLKNYHLDIMPIFFIEISKQIYFETLVNYILHLKNEGESSKSHYFEQIIDGMVYELYFEKELKEHKKDILQFLQNLPAITDEMPDIEKEEIINKVYEELNDSEHPVKKRLYYMDSIPEIRIIEGKEVH